MAGRAEPGLVGNLRSGPGSSGQGDRGKLGDEVIYDALEGLI